MLTQSRARPPSANPFCAFVPTLKCKRGRDFLPTCEKLKLLLGKCAGRRGQEFGGGEVGERCLKIEVIRHKKYVEPDGSL